MTEQGFLDQAERARPAVTMEDAAVILDGVFGVRGRIVELGSQQDRNFRVETEDGRRFVLKVCHADYGFQALDAQNAAMRHIGARSGAPAVPTPLLSVDGRDIVELDIRGELCLLRLLTYLDGEPLTRRVHLGEETIAALGALAAELSLALADFTHPGLDRALQWDLRRAGPVALHLLSSLPDPQRKRRLADPLVAAMRRLQPLSAALRVQAVHHDVTDDNVVARREKSGRLVPEGVIDFGDILNGWLVADLAVTCAALLHHADGDPFAILPAIAAYHARLPLTVEELKALWPLIVARATVLVASSERQLAVDPDNDYVAGNIDHERLIFDVANSVPMALMEAAILEVAGVAAAPLPPVASLIPSLDPAAVQTIDLSTTSTAFEAADFLAPRIEEELLDAAARRTGHAATRYGEYRLTRTAPILPHAPETFALHVMLSLPVDTLFVAPFDGTIAFRDDGIVLTGPDLALHLSGRMRTAAEGPVTAGSAIAATEDDGGGQGMVRLALSREADLVPPLLTRPSRAAAWKRIAPSPALVLGFDCDAPAPGNENLLERRQRHFARPQKNYYRKPPQIERGLREHMFDVEGRSFLDMVNNVTTIGHGHPRLAAAVGRQWSMLNTNSRFHYAAVAEFSERLAGLAPEGLDTVFLVNSGSEAVDLAVRLAWAASGRRNIVSLLEAYHGWTVASDAVSTSIADNPQALTTRPEWVHPVTSPNLYRGKYRGADAGRRYTEDALAKIEELGDRLAGFICEPVYGNAGGISLPEGYLPAIYEAVRSKGGVCIADEVQVGYGRLGHSFWGFEQQGVVPDIITVAKGMGNGHPLGAVITSRKIADALEREGYFFSSSGGSPVSAVVGMTVLDVLRDERLVENAREVGDYLKARLEALGQRFPLVGTVHGMGLYLGLEFVRDRETLEPATEETAAICDRLLDLGVIMQPTGDHLNVLKIKPPLCLAKESADFFVDMLERVLAEGW